MTTNTFESKGMHCSNCETLISRKLMHLEGVESVKADYPSETVDVTYDEEKLSTTDIFDKLADLGYNQPKTNKTPGIIAGLLGIVIVGYFLFNFVEGISMPAITANMSYGLLFVVGLLTGFHCVSMCGGFVVSYTTKAAQEGKKSHKSHLAYGIGKVISYTVIGAAFGLLGSIFVFTPMMRGVAGIIAGAFLVIFGLNMLNLFPVLRKIRIKAPKFLNKFVNEETRKHNSPLVIGLLNGLMIACGPLQAIYIMAAGTGSAVEGAKLLFIFALGTLPVMLGFGFLTSFISKKATTKILKVSGVVVIILGLIMLNRGLALTGTGYDLNTLTDGSNGITGNTVALEGDYQVIKMDVTRSGWVPNKFVLQKGVPVKWEINGKEITGCNNAIQVPKLDLEFDIKKGKQVIEFTPDKEGTIPFSCWMGMIPGTFIVTDEAGTADSQAVLDTVEVAAGGSCGGSGGCGCGGAR